MDHKGINCNATQAEDFRLVKAQVACKRRKIENLS